ncbi:hypothetical protein B0T17DRAFT_499384 [Bombardia bombarda]|uniref:SMP-30/Gluconolactonase/LRE-like region domain-containing protein n=1 Tax=Bombardia bombarda TaxID=252184 RepID=A0AA39WAT0_9PEZI|nr:hypothetical protein B0T17DRAFT_499384 [Bombardia bombarda]
MIGALLLATADPGSSHWLGVAARDVPPLAQVINQKSFNVLRTVSPPSTANGTSQFIPPGATKESLLAKPFHIYDDAFYDIIGPNPTLTLLNRTESNPRFHEAPVWYPATDEVFFCQNAGARAAGTGLNKSAAIMKIALADVTTEISSQRSANGTIRVEFVNPSPGVVNCNGGTNYRNRILLVGEGQGYTVAPAIYLMHPYSPYNTTVLLDNFFGRQFNSINDASVNPRNGDIYFTDPTYGYVQDFRPAPGLQKQVWRFNESTGAVGVVADGFNMPNGLAFSPNGQHIYIADTGTAQGFFGNNYTFPATVYRYDVEDDGTFANRKVFAFVTAGVPDGIHLDTKGNVYVACGDGVEVYSPAGKLLGRIYIGSTSANFQFAGKGRMVILAETELYYATLGAEGAFPGQLH